MEVILIIVAFFLFIWIVPLILRKPKSKYTKKEVDHAFLRLEAEVMASLNKVKSKEIDSEYILLTKKAYLKSTKWQSKRKQRLALDHYSCAACSISGVPLAVHHLHYRSSSTKRWKT
jgi:5-methylcytosine-specific restriction endonuclease McrA